ncbi:MAG: hypothetical protein JRH11_03445 [Deltaproteobacteria bacterium]|nr:hypothetical protein [Deltaproteobacteria bacterium]
MFAIFTGDVRAEDVPGARAGTSGPAYREPEVREVMVRPPATSPPIEIVVDTRATPAVVEVAPEPQEPQDPGTHFIVELNLGSSFTGSVGFAGSLLVGAGGRLRGFPPIFYLVGEAGFQLGGSDGQIDGARYVDGREYGDISLGLRTYLPILRDLRIFLDILPGATFVTSSLARDGLTELHTSGWYAHFAFGGGVQGRIFRELSAGLRVKVLATDDGLDDAREALGIYTPMPVVLSGTVTWHL